MELSFAAGIDYKAGKVVAGIELAVAAPGLALAVWSGHIDYVAQRDIDYFLAVRTVPVVPASEGYTDSEPPVHTALADSTCSPDTLVCRHSMPAPVSYIRKRYRSVEADAAIAAMPGHSTEEEHMFLA